MAFGALDFLKGGGEMGAKMRALDWNTTPLGPPETWPQSLKTIVRVMLDSRFAMWMMWGREGSFFCNDAYLPTLGVKGEWGLGVRADKVWEEVWPAVQSRIEGVLRTGEATFDEGLQLFLRRSGEDEETFHTFSYSPVYDKDDRIAGMLCVVAEDTTRVIAERRLRSLRQLAAFSTRDAVSVDAAGVGLLQALETNRFDLPFAALYALDAGSHSARLVACNQRVAEGRMRASIDLATDVPAWPIAAVMSRGSVRLIERLGDAGLTILGPWDEPVEKAMLLPLGDGAQARPVAVLVVGLSTRRPLDAAYRGFLGLVADQFASALADTRIRLEARARADALAELDRAKNVFFGNVSHELRTPLTLMLGPIDELLSSGTLAPEIAEPLRLAQRNGARLRKLVNSLLDFSRIEAGQVDARYMPTDLAAFTADLAAVFRSAVERAGLQLVVRCAPLAEPVYVDRDMWERVVLNLLSNALKHTFEGEIEVALAVEGSTVHLGVRDTGVGIAADELPRIFERFHRVAGARARTQEGTGIGLALVQELVRLHGGSISAISTPGAGSCFTVSIPLGAAHLAPERVHAESPADAAPQASLAAAAFVDDALRASAPSGEAAAPAPRDRPVGGGRRERVLVVDDNGDMRSYVAKLLRPYWDVSVAADGQEALAAIDAALPDLVITDMHMPVLDGRGLIQHIRTRKAAHALPVIVLSAQAGEEQRAAGLEQGADDYLVKPFSTRELLARVEVQLARARLRSQGTDPSLWDDTPP